MENPPIIVVPTHGLSPEETGSQRPVWGPRQHAVIHILGQFSQTFQRLIGACFFFFFLAGNVLHLRWRRTAVVVWVLYCFSACKFARNCFFAGNLLLSFLGIKSTSFPLALYCFFAGNVLLSLFECNTWVYATYCYCAGNVLLFRRQRTHCYHRWVEYWFSACNILLFLWQSSAIIGWV